MTTNPFDSSNAFADKYQPPTLRPQLPTAAYVFGILHCIFGVLGICSLPFACLMFFMPTDPAALEMNPALKLMTENQWYRTFNMVGIGLGFVATVVLIVAGIGLLNQKPIGRTLSIGYGWYAIIMGIVGLLINVFFVFPVLLEALEKAPEGPAKAGAIGGLVGGLIGSAVGFVYPGLLLYFMYRPNVIAAFQPAERDRF